MEYFASIYNEFVPFQKLLRHGKEHSSNLAQRTFGGSLPLHHLLCEQFEDPWASSQCIWWSVEISHLLEPLVTTDLLFGWFMH